jgi:hypothetical protein
LKMAPLLAVITSKKAFLKVIQTDLSCTPKIIKALCLNVFIRGIFRVPIEMVIVDGELRNIIHDALGNWPACVVHVNTCRTGLRVYTPARIIYCNHGPHCGIL